MNINTVIVNCIYVLVFFLNNILNDNFGYGQIIRHSRGRLFRGRRHGNEIYYSAVTDNNLELPLLNVDNSYTKNVSKVLEITAETSNSKKNYKFGMLNNSWQQMDKSMLYMGERALNQIDVKKKNKTRNAKLDDNSVDDEDSLDEESWSERPASETARSGHVDIVTRFLRIVESQHLLGENCTAGTDLNLGEGVVDRYAQERFRVEANVAVNRANMLTRLWKYAEPEVVMSEYFLHASVFAMVEFDNEIFAAGNCYDQYQYKDYWLFCPYAYRLPEGTILVKDLAVEYKYLSNTSEWFYIARKNAEKVIRNYSQFSRGYNTYTHNETHTQRIPDEILSVRYDDGKWSKPYYDCGGGNIWMLTYTVPFFGFQNNTYFFKGTSGIDIDLRRVDIDQCPLPKGSTQLNIFAASDKCKKRTTDCVPIAGLGFRRGSYKCVCKRGFFFPDVKAEARYYNGTIIEEEYEKLMLGEKNQYSKTGVFECFACPEGCEYCEDDRPCVVSLDWVMRTVILVLSCIIICCLPVVAIFTWKYSNVKVVRAASPVLLCFITLGAFLIYCTMIVMYPRPNMYTCITRVWLREIGFALTYGALMLKTWRISVIFRVRSAKAVKITDINLLKRLGVIVAIFAVFLAIRTLVAPPVVIVGRTADDLKAYLCQTDWWDHSFTLLEVMFLVWGIRLCIVVRKAPSEFNESRFISMAIYNEFLLSVFLNISMLFLQKPANPDLLYIIFFCHTQLTVTLLLCLIFGSKIENAGWHCVQQAPQSSKRWRARRTPYILYTAAGCIFYGAILVTSTEFDTDDQLLQQKFKAYMVYKNQGQNEDSMMSKTTTSKFLGKARSANSQYTSTNSSAGGLEFPVKYTDHDVHEEFLRLYTELGMLKEKNMRVGNRHIASKITAMQDAAKSHDHAQSAEKKPRASGKSSKTLEVVCEKVTCDVVSAMGESLAKMKRQSVTFASETDSKNDIAEPQAGPSFELKSNEDDTQEKASPPTEKNDRCLKSGHAKTHAIVINLDDKSRFTEEVTV